MKVFQVTALLFLLATTTIATSGFSDTCDGFDPIEGHFLEAECQGSPGKEETYLDLNKLRRQSRQSTDCSGQVCEVYSVLKITRTNILTQW